MLDERREQRARAVRHLFMPSRSGARRRRPSCRSLTCSIAPPPAAASTFDEGVRLYREAPLHELGAAAHARRMAMYPTNDVTYVVDTTINYTNVCNVHCTFCAFFRPEHHAKATRCRTTRCSSA